MTHTERIANHGTYEVDVVRVTRYLIRAESVNAVQWRLKTGCDVESAFIEGTKQISQTVLRVTEVKPKKKGKKCD